MLIQSTDAPEPLLAMYPKICTTFSLFAPKRLSGYPSVVLAIDFEQYTLSTNACTNVSMLYTHVCSLSVSSYVCVVVVEYAMLCSMVKGVSTVCFTSS